MEFREWLISKDLPFENRVDNCLLVPEEVLVPFYPELMLLFPLIFIRSDDVDEIPHRI